MKTDLTSRIASLLLVFFFVYNDVHASAHALMHWDELSQSIEILEEAESKLPVVLKESAKRAVDQVDDDLLGPSPALSSSHTSVAPALDNLEQFTVKALEDEARIGMELNMPLNDPSDDIFNFVLPPDFKAEDWSTIYLNYEVKGVADGAGLAKSFNSNETFGSRSLAKDEQWHSVREKVSPADLQAGGNYLRFTVPNGLDLSVEVKNLALDFDRQADGALQSARLERVETEDAQYFTSVPTLEGAGAFRLREVEMPALPQGIINITSGAKAYQPNAKVVAEAKQIGFKLNIGSLTSQQKLRELQVYYFDYAKKAWQGVAIDSIDTHGEIAFVPNKGQTQYFGALIKSPEMPEASAFSPTMMQDIEAANPAAGINLIQAPSISRTGEASLSYPLQIPGGRKGMQPQLAISYNSDGGSSWAGYGWSIGSPSISVDTRWGVPRYDSQEQSEAYMLNGQALFEEGGDRPNRSTYDRSQSNEVRFYEKTRSGYKDLVRHGNGPQNYFWIETDAAGNKYYYGTYDGVNLANDGVLKSNLNGAGNIARWMLCRVEDNWGNYYEYHYNRDETGSGHTFDLHQAAQRIVLDYIEYTGHTSGTANPQYKVEFNYTDERTDASWTYNLGFKVLDDFLLRTIKVYYDQNLSKEYKLQFENPSEGNLFKTLLTEIEEWRSGQFFNSHKLEYFDGQIGFDPNYEVVGHNVEETALFAGIADDLRGAAKTVVLNSPEMPVSKSSSAGVTGKISMGAGFNPTIDLFGKNSVFSLNITGGLKYSQQRQALRDMNGDGIPDLLIHTLRGDKYYPITRNANGKLVKGAPLDIKTEVFNRSYTSSLDYGWDGLMQWKTFGLYLDLGQNWNKSLSTTYQYLLDYNSDGIPDLMRPTSDNDFIYFGYLDEFGAVHHNEHSNLTLNPIITGATPPADPGPTPDIAMEVVRVWIAPFTGTIDISGTASVHTQGEGAAKVAVDFQDSFAGTGFQDVEIGSPVSMAFSGISVTEGDSIFFRTHCGANGQGDLVTWDPEIEYVNHVQPKQNAIGTNYSQSLASEGFLLSGQYGAILNSGNDLKVTWSPLTINNSLSDDIRFVIGLLVVDSASGNISHNYEYERVLSAGSTGAILESQFAAVGGAPNPNFIGSKNSIKNLISGSANSDKVTLSFRIESNSNIDWQAIDWRPTLEVELGSCIEAGNPDLYPLVDYQTYNRLISYKDPLSSLSLNPNDEYRIWPTLPGTIDYTQFFSQDELDDFTNNQNLITREVYLVLKEGGEFISKAAISFKNDESYSIHALNTDGKLAGELASIYANATSGYYRFEGQTIGSQDVYLEAYSKHEDLAKYWSSNVFIYELANLTEETATRPNGLIASVYATNRSLLFDQILHWGQFGWNPENLTDNISSLDIKVATEDMAAANNFTVNPVPGSSDVTSIGSSFPSMDDLRYLSIAAMRGELRSGLKDYIEATSSIDKQFDRYSIIGSHAGVYREAGMQAPGYFLEPDLGGLVLDPPPTGTDIAYAQKMRSRDYTMAYNFSLGATFKSSIKPSYTNSQMPNMSAFYSEPTRQFMDVNGDGYPDFWGGDGNVEIRNTNALGGLESTVNIYGTGYKGKRTTSSNSVGVSQGAYLNQDLIQVDVEDDATYTRSLGGAYDITTNETIIEWMDVNGDGLLDQVTDNAGSRAVRINDGYSLLPETIWSSLVRSRGRTSSYSLNGGLNAMDKESNSKSESFRAGVNVNRVSNYNNIQYVDITGDGLPDKLDYNTATDDLFFEVNTGSGYATYTGYGENLDQRMNENVTTGISVNAAFPVFSTEIYNVKVNVNVSGTVNASLSSSQTSFMDMNGDGAVDLLVNDGNDYLKVFYNKVGKSNKLKQVSTPLNGSFVLDYRLEGNKVGYHEAQVRTHRDNDNSAIYWDMPQGKWVMASVTINDSVDIDVNGTNLDGYDSFTTTYHYDGGVKSRREREFLGFSRVEVKQPQVEYYLSEYAKASVPVGYEPIPWPGFDDDFKVNRYYSEVMMFEQMIDTDFDSRKRHEYKHDVLRDHMYFLNFEISYNMEDATAQIPLIEKVDLTKKLISHKHQAIDYFEVENSGVNKNQNSEIAVVWANLDETSTLFPAVINAETIVRPLMDSSDVFMNVNLPASHFNQATEFTAVYDKYFNVERYEHGSASSNTTVTKVPVDTINHFYYETQSFDVLIEDLIDNTTTNFTTTTLTAHDYPNALCFEVVYTTLPGYLPDTICIESYWDPNEPDCGGAMFSGEGREPSITVTFRKPVHEMIFIEEDNYNINYNANLIAVMDYYEPNLGANTTEGTGILKDHRIYEGSTGVPASRHSKIINLNNGSPTVIEKVLSSTASAFVDIHYDDFGNVDTLDGPLDANGQRGRIYYNYDNVVHSYVEKITNPFGESVANYYDYETGNLLRTIGLNGYPVHYVYDEFFRIKEVWAPLEYYAYLENNVNEATITFEYDLDGYDPNSGNSNEGVPVAITNHNINAPESAYANLNFTPLTASSPLTALSSNSISNPLQTATFVDGFGQPVQVKKDVSSNDGNGAYLKKREVSGFSFVDIQGRPRYQGWSQLEDHTIDIKKLNESSIFTSPTNPKQSSTSYDLLGRPLVQTTFVNNAKQIITEYSYFETEGNYDESIGYLGVLTQTGQGISSSYLVSLSVINDLGQQIEQHGFRGANFSNPEVTQFEYNALNELLKSINPAGDTTKYVYDDFGRMLSEDHNDRGVTTMEYDLASNLIKTITPATGATGIQNKYSYGRLLKTIYPLTGELNSVEYTYGSLGDGFNGAGRIVKIAQGNGFKTDSLKYDVLGNLIYEKKQINVPLAGDRDFVNEFSYDSWGRLRSMIYPDGEEVDYFYNATGDLHKMLGMLPNQSSSYSILDSMLYDGFGNASYIVYGNGAVTELSYDATRRMHGVELNSNGSQLLDKLYTYDDRGNVASVVNNAAAVNVNGVNLGGEYSLSSISYDGLNQVEYVKQEFGPSAGLIHDIEMTMTYSSAGRIATKNLNDVSSSASNYAHSYLYDNANNKPHKLQSVVNSLGNNMLFEYNNVGSITEKREEDGVGPGTDLVETFCWNEHQTLRGVKRGDEDHAEMAHYVYDYSGERVLKSLISGSILNTNSQGQTVLSMESPTVYVSPYFIATHYSETVLASKHYYMGSQRIASALTHLPFTTGSQEDPGLGGEGEGGEGPGFGGGNISSPEDAVFQDLTATLECLYDGSLGELDYETLTRIPSIGEDFTFDDCNGRTTTDPRSIGSSCACEQSTYWAQIGGVDCSAMPIIYWYHPDYLGSIEFVTDMDGNAYQFFHNTIWGENLQNQMAFTYTAFSSRFRFNGKEWDEETGNFYYGARYYDPKLSLWLSVDPLAAKYPYISPFNFVENNPLRLIDPTGMGPEDSEGGPSHVLLQNETLYGLVHRTYKSMGLTVEQLKEWNNITDVHNIPKGQEILLYNPNQPVGAGGSMGLGKKGSNGSAPKSGSESTVKTGKDISQGAGLFTTIWGSALESSAEFTPQYAQRGVTQASLAEEAANFSKGARYAARAGNILTGASAMISIAEYSYSDQSWGDKTKLGVNLGIAGLGLVRDPVCMGLSVGLGVAETAGAFDGLYDYADFTEQTGILIIPANTFTNVPIILNIR